MNLKIPLKIRNQDLEGLLEYAKACGFPVKKNDLGDLIEYSIDHPHYKATPLAESVHNEATNRWTHYAYIRL